MHPLLGDLPICKALAIPKHPTGPSEFSTMTSNQVNLAPENQFLLWCQELEARQEEQVRKVAELREQANRLREENERLRTQMEVGRLSNHESLPAHFLLPILARAKRPLRGTISIYRPMMSYSPAAPRFRAVHHLRTSWKTILEKGYLADLAGPSVSLGVECRENPAGTNDPPHQLTNMCSTELRISLDQYQPCTHLSGLPSHCK